MMTADDRLTTSAPGPTKGAPRLLLMRRALAALPQIAIDRRLLGATLLIALVLRLLLWSQPLHQPANDEIEYINVARDLLAGRGWQLYEHFEWLRAPFYSLFLAGSLWLAGGDLHRAALPNIALSVATVYLSYRLACALVGRRAAPLSALLTTLLWTNATFASLYMSETLFTFLFTAALLALVQGCRPQQSGPAGTTQSRSVDRCFRSAVVAGLLLGLATLTRSITLLFLPMIALWLLFARRAENGHVGPLSEPARRRLTIDRCGPAVIVVLAAALTIAPWTIRNVMAYGRPILVETGLSYNLWFFNEPLEDHETIYRTLESITNPAERSDYATAKGMQRLREDPAILLRKLLPNWIYLWRIKPIQDRFLQEDYNADIGLPLFAAALVFDDALYLLILLAGVAGLLLYQRPAARHTLSAWLGAPQSLCLAWVSYVLLTVLLTHGEGRYRHFLFPILIPYAAWAWTQLRAMPTGQPADADHKRRSLLAPVLLAPLWAALLSTVLIFYPWSWAGNHLARGWYVAIGDLAWRFGAQQRALASYEHAAAAYKTVDGWLRVGDTMRALGDSQRALRAYEQALNVEPSYIPASARLGDLLRELGDLRRARKAFGGFYADAQQMTDWSWRELHPRPQSLVDMGGGLDFGYVAGVYPAERQQGMLARWTNGRGMLRLSAGPGTTRALALVQLRLAAPHPGGAPVQTRVCVTGRCWTVAVEPTWRTYQLPFETGSDGMLLIEIQSPVFHAPDGRQLGVLIDSAAAGSMCVCERS